MAYMWTDEDGGAKKGKGKLKRHTGYKKPIELKQHTGYKKTIEPKKAEKATGNAKAIRRRTPTG